MTTFHLLLNDASYVVDSECSLTSKGSDSRMQKFSGSPGIGGGMWGRSRGFSHSGCWGMLKGIAMLWVASIHIAKHVALSMHRYGTCNTGIHASCPCKRFFEDL